MVKRQLTVALPLARRTCLVYGEGVLKGSREVLVRKIQPVSIHGQLSMDVYFADPDDPDGQVSIARLGAEAIPRGLQSGDRVLVHYLVGTVTRITRLEPTAPKRSQA